MLAQDMLSPWGGRTGWRNNVLKVDKRILLQTGRLSLLGNLLLTKLKIKPSYLLAPVHPGHFFPSTWLSVIAKAVLDGVVY